MALRVARLFGRAPAEWLNVLRDLRRVRPVV